MKHSIAHLYMLHTYMEVFSIRLSIAETKEFCRRKIKNFFNMFSFTQQPKMFWLTLLGLNLDSNCSFFFFGSMDAKKKIFLLQNLGKNALCCCCEKMATGCCLLSAPNTLPLTHSAADGRDTVGWALLLLFVWLWWNGAYTQYTYI